MTSVWKVVPPEAFGLYVAQEVGALGLVTIVVGVAIVGLVGARRPD